MAMEYHAKEKPKYFANYILEHGFAIFREWDRSGSLGYNAVLLVSFLSFVIGEEFKESRCVGKGKRISTVALAGDSGMEPKRQRSSATSSARLVSLRRRGSRDEAG
ncbi:hypothetical protein LR48_Vigan08g126600 [Vigna angularis]|uniref:Uncharacterized protein n=1 Tax=Phaseolus angularis TaxID=3914 RepID=A0A0L9V720_PHAAN|nr:hypothetical protein LR48_Vigan08g126600 [Vigna angularis]